MAAVSAWSGQKNGHSLFYRGTDDRPLSTAGPSRHGAFGSGWKAHDTKLDRTVALKIPRNVHLDEAETELFLLDARAAKQLLRHSNIVSVHEVAKQDDTIYIVSDFIDGVTLREWTADKLLRPKVAAALCVKIAKARHRIMLTNPA